ncbi:MAG TPA: CE1759 family FMN reductase [Actinoplanes sp.]
MKHRNLVVVSAGLSRPSSTRLLADRLAAAAEPAADRLDVRLDTRVVELRDHAHDLTNHLLTGFPPAGLGEVLDAVAGADAVIAVTPIFTASYSGLFKSFFDVLDDEAMVGKPVLIAATGGTARHSLALEHAVRPMFAYLRAVVVPTAVYAASEDWGGAGAGTGTGTGTGTGSGSGSGSGTGTDTGALRSRIERAAAELAAEIARREPVTVADPFALSTSFEELLAGGA